MGPEEERKWGRMREDVGEKGRRREGEEEAVKRKRWMAGGKYRAEGGKGK